MTWVSHCFPHEIYLGHLVPTTNLVEVKHASMRASVGYKDRITLFEATSVDLFLVVLQSVKYNAYQRVAIGLWPKYD